MLGDQKQSCHGALPLWRLVFCFRQLGDVLRGVAKRYQRFALG
jgi:hypothetical protein